MTMTRGRSFLPQRGGEAEEGMKHDDRTACYFRVSCGVCALLVNTNAADPGFSNSHKNAHTA